MRAELRYGEGSCAVEIPDTFPVWIAHRGVTSASPDSSRALHTALSQPTGTPPLEQIARGKRHACIVISDNTRATPSAYLLEGILKRIPDVPRVTVLVATGLHTPLPQDAVRALAGSYASARCEVLSHDARDDSQLILVGSTPRGMPILLNRLFAESDLRILTGHVEPHFMAGYSGGRKAVCPGILGQRSIQFLHSPALLESPCADYGILRGNPVHEEALWAARSAGVDFIVNVVLDEQQRVVHASAGDLEAAWLACVRYVERISLADAPGLFDVVLTSAGGYPLDRNFYQAVKGLVAAARIVKQGGIILLASECRDGLGSDGFRRALRMLAHLGDLDAFLAHISDEAHWILDQWEVEMLVRVLRRVSALWVVSDGMARDDVELAHAEAMESLAAGIERARQICGPTATVAVMPEGPHVIPVLLEQAAEP